MPDKNIGRNSEKSRTGILENALEYFYKHGIKELDETEFFKGLGISPNEFYSMFRNKDDILEQAVRHTTAGAQTQSHRRVTRGTEGGRLG